MDRRNVLRALAALAALPEGAARGQEAQTSTLRISKETLAEALKVIGLEYTDEQLQQAIRNVNEQLKQMDDLRNVMVPLDVEPAFRFSPRLHSL